MKTPVAIFLLLLSVDSATAQTEPPRVDNYGDPLPLGAVGRFGTVRFRQSSSVRAVAYSPDGKRIAANGGGGFQVWDCATGKQLLVCKVDEGGVDSLAWSANGQLIGSGGGDNVIRLWSADTGKELLQCLGHQGKTNTLETGVAELLFRNDNAQLASLGKDNTIRLWSVTTGKEVRQFTGHQGSARHIALAADGKTLAAYIVASHPKKEAGEVRVWEVETGKLVAHWPMPGDLGFRGFSPDLRIFLTRNRNDPPRDLVFWDLTSGKHVRSLPETSWALFTPDGKAIVTQERNCLRLWDAHSTGEITCIPWTPSNASSYVFAPDMKTLAGFGGFASNVLRFWDTTTGDERRQCDGHDGPIRTIAFSPDGKTLAASDFRELRTWDVMSRSTVHRFATPYSWWNGLTFSADSKTLTAWNQNRLIHQWDVTTETEAKINQATFFGGSLQTVAFLPGEDRALLVERQMALFGGRANRIGVWDTKTWKPNRTWEYDNPFVTSVVVSPDGATVFAGGYHKQQIGNESSWRILGPDLTKDYVVYRWDIGSSKALPHMGKHESYVDRVALSADGRSLAAATAKGPIHVWATSIGFERVVIDPEIRVASLAFSPDARYLATVYDTNFPLTTDPRRKDWRAERKNNHIRVWDLFTGKEVHGFGPHQGPVSTIAFSPDGTLLASASSDTTVLLWDMNSVYEKSRLTPAETDPQILWKDLIGSDGGKAYRAMWSLTAIPKQAVPFLIQRVEPIHEVDAKDFERLLVGLNSDQFTVRQKAMRELEDLGVRARPALRRVLAGNPSEELRRRAEQLLKLAENPKTEPLRIMEVLEHVGNVEALEHLRLLAGGVPDARLTQEARACVERLMRRSKQPGPTR